MGRSTGTGQPLWFQCSKCRLRSGRVWSDRRAYSRSKERGGADRVRLTGRARSLQSLGNASGRNSTHKREYVCLDCGHCGWSRHIALETHWSKHRERKIEESRKQEREA